MLFTVFMYCICSMKGKGKGDRREDMKDCPLNFPDVTPVAHVEECTRYAAGRFSLNAGITLGRDMLIFSHLFARYLIFLRFYYMYPIIFLTILVKS